MTRNNEGRAGGVFDALAHPTRREILRYLRTRDYVRAGALGEALGVVPSTLSGHLRVLRDAGLVESRRRGTEIQYRVQLTLLDEAILLLQGLRSGTGDDEQSRTPGRTDDDGPGAPAPGAQLPEQSPADAGPGEATTTQGER
ncbi:ArsR/SmtB family transcription factor [Cellulomonas iranensis]|uniref:ArsR/SmtB family transcription factor n=1 Tax=Cellulomonas iranensis TaxID=76862 RepID=UPI0013D50E22|nr:metalloregulator ArsR/SmtB family transcription factor [Cellulomonas iranensis]